MKNTRLFTMKKKWERPESILEEKKWFFFMSIGKEAYEGTVNGVLSKDEGLLRLEIINL